VRVLLAVSIVALSLGCSRGLRPDSPVAGMKPLAGKAYSSEAGEHVTIVPLEPAEVHKALVAFEGTKSELDGKVLVANVDRDRGTGYWTEWRGRHQRFVTVHNRGGFEDLVLSAVGYPTYTHLKLDTGRTAAIQPEKVLAKYADQEGDKKYQALLKFDRKFWETDAQNDLALADAETNKACGSKLKTTVAWDTVTDETLNELSFGSYCRGPVESLAKLCERSDEAKRAIQKVQAVECRVDTAAALKMESQKVIWSIVKGETVQPDKTTTFFVDNL
jgi:hypothetical protein